MLVGSVTRKAALCWSQPPLYRQPSELGDLQAHPQSRLALLFLPSGRAASAFWSGQQSGGGGPCASSRIRARQGVRPLLASQQPLEQTTQVTSREAAEAP